MLPSRGPSASKMVPSIIGEDLTIRGNVTSKGEVQLEGEIEGEIRCGSLLLGDKGQVMGGVAAEDVVVRGRIIGSIRGLRVTLQAQCHVAISFGMLSKYRPRRFKRAPSRFNIRLAGISSVLVTLLCPPAAKFGGSWGHAYLRQNWKNRSHYAQGPKVRSDQWT